MTATSQAESAALTLPPAARAQVAMGTSMQRAALTAMVKQSAGIVAILNADGRTEAHGAAMHLRATRVAIEKTGKAAREDATAFSKAIIAEEKALIDIIAPEEARVLALRDKWDADREAEKQAKIAAERARIDRLRAIINEVCALPAQALGKTSVEIAALAASLTPQRDLTELEDLAGEYCAARADALAQLAKAEDAQLAAEAAAEAQRQEAERLQAERAELARLRAEADERNRAAQAEAARIAAEQAETARKLAEQQAAIELAAERQREAEEARVRAEQEARDRAQAAANAELLAAQERLAAEQAAFKLAQQVELDHAEALVMDLEFDLAASEKALAIPLNVPLSLEEIARQDDITENTAESDIDFLSSLADAKDMTLADLFARICAIDFDAVRAELAEVTA